MAQAVNWNPDRYGSVKSVLEFDSNTGTYSLVEAVIQLVQLTKHRVQLVHRLMKPLVM